MNVPFMDLRRSYLDAKQNIEDKVFHVMDTQKFILGEIVEKFEQEFAESCGSKYAVGVASGSDALVLALMACDIGPGDEVITTPFTYVATAEAITRVGATPVFVDVDIDTMNIDPKLIKKAITDKTKAIIPVHLFGLCCNMQDINWMVGGGINVLAEKPNIVVIEDAAQAFGSFYNGKKAGSIGHIGCHSFFPTKNLGGFGDGGACTTDFEHLYLKLKALRIHGSKKKYHHVMMGMNSRLDAIQAIVLSVKLRFVEQWIDERARLAFEYFNGLEKFCKVPSYRYDEGRTFHQYTVQIDDRDEIQRKLSFKGISTAIYYPLPLHLQECFSYLGYKQGDFPNAESLASRVLSLPIFPGLTSIEQQYIITNLQKCLDEMPKA